MSISKTRQKLVDVARQLFAKSGFENTTMNDIAVASGKGRRTLYTYFKSKEDVYYAVIESELERLSDKMDEVAAKKMRPQDKIIELIVAMGLEVDDCQNALKFSGKAPLYPRVKRDSIIIYGINNHQSIFQINESLKKNGEDLLKNSGEEND